MSDKLATSAVNGWSESNSTLKEWHEHERLSRAINDWNDQ